MRQRGFTLLEMLVSVAILVMVMAMVSSLVLFGARMTRQGEEYADTNEGARVAAESIANAARNAGMGMSAGLWVSPGGTPANYSPVWVQNSTTGPDSLWLVVPNTNALAGTCSSQGAGQVGGATTVQRTNSGGTALAVRCTNTVSPFPTLAVSNMLAAALITPNGFTAASGTTPGTVTYAESASGFSDSPSRGGFQIGDLMFPVTIQHYFVQGGRLMMKAGVVSGTAGTPFADGAGAAIAVADDIEDFQVAVAVDTTLSDDPAAFVWQNGVGPLWTQGVRALRVSVAAMSKRKVLNDQGLANLSAGAGFAPQTLEDHTPADGGTDGRRRSFVTKRIELPNAYPYNL